MDGQFSSFHHHHYPFLSEQDYEYPTNAPEKPRQLPSSNNTTAVPPKKSKRAVQKRVVSIPIGDPDGTRTKGEAPPPSDSWAWRKYGQKPIKGSPYPRGYYRCSSSKGCPARKQVERSRADPTMLLITYACEHNHPWPISSRHAKSAASHVPKSSPERFSPAPETGEKFADVETETAARLPMAEEEFCWFSDVASSPAVDPVLQSPIYAGRSSDDVEAMFFPMREEDESLFADLGELPEYSVVFRCGLRPASLCGSIG